MHKTMNGVAVMRRTSGRQKSAAWIGAGLTVIAAVTVAPGAVASTGEPHPPGRSTVEVFREAPVRAGSGRALSHLDPDLADVNRSAAPLRLARSEGIAVVGRRLRLVVRPRRGMSAAVTRAIVGEGGVVEARAAGLVQALVRPAAAALLAKRADVVSVGPTVTPVLDAIPGENIAATNAGLWQAAGFKGAGVKVAIIDLGFAGLAARRAEGEIPGSVVTADFCGGAFSTATEHGTAVAEIVSEEAPAAQLYLYCVNSPVTLAQAEQAAKANGVRVISHSVSWFNTWRGDGSGPAGTPDATVADARANNILWINSAGNYAQAHWSGTFSDSDNDRWLNVSGNDEGNTFQIPPNVEECARLRWNEWPTATSDYDLYLVDAAGGAILAKSERRQATVSTTPTETACYTNTSGATRQVSAAIYQYKADPAPSFDLFTEGAPLEYQTAARSVTDPAASLNALAVGAVCWQNAALEDFSSQGPTIAGTLKPEISAPDSVSTATYGSFTGCPSGFAGTSAAAPVVAGLAALVLQRQPSFTAAQVQSYLVAHAKDRGTPGADNGYGAGEALLPPLAPVITYPSASSSDVTRSQATLRATVDSRDSPTSVSFEYGSSTSYGATTPAQSINGTEQGPVTVTAPITGLPAGTRIHFRLDAKNLGGQVNGADQAFTTVPDDPPRVHALAATGKLGSRIRLRFTVSDDTGEARETLRIYSGSRIIKTLALGFAPAGNANTRAAIWRAPQTQTGHPQRRFCVKAWDRGNHASLSACAAIELR
jgi:hypothetical protein